MRHEDGIFWVAADAASAVDLRAALAAVRDTFAMAGADSWECAAAGFKAELAAFGEPVAMTEAEERLAHLWIAAGDAAATICLGGVEYGLACALA